MLGFCLCICGRYGTPEQLQPLRSGPFSGSAAHPSSEESMLQYNTSLRERGTLEVTAATEPLTPDDVNHAVVSVRGIEGFGVVRWLGAMDGAPATRSMVGVELDGPWGTCDGTLDGSKYFSCMDRHGYVGPVANVTREQVTARKAHSVPAPRRHGSVFHSSA